MTKKASAKQVALKRRADAARAKKLRGDLGAERARSAALHSERGALCAALADAPEQERYRIARIAHTQLARWATMAAITGEHVEGGRTVTIPLLDLVAWFDALSPRARTTREMLEREAMASMGATQAGPLPLRLVADEPAERPS